MHLEDCIKSFIEDLARNDEVILVEDSSTDNSASICAKLADSYSQIRIIYHPYNRGLSAARNSGIIVSQGEYITFIDSDDFLAPKTLYRNIQILNDNPNIDILEYPVSVHHFSDINYLYTPGENVTETYTDWILRKGYRHSYAWNKIYKRSLWENTKFPVGKHLEDLFTIPYIMEKATTIFASNIGCYYYCLREKSICTSANITFYKDHLDATERLFIHIKNKNILSKHKLDILYCQTCDSHILYLQYGGKTNSYIIHKISFTSIQHAETIIQKSKMLIMWCLGKYYCKTVSLIRKLTII